MPNVKGSLYGTTDAPRTLSTHQNSRRYPWTISGFAKDFRLWRVPTIEKLSLPWRLCRSREAINRNNSTAFLLQNQIPFKFLPPSRKPRISRDKQALWLLRRV
jgi:hypothetical protein